MDFYLLIIGIVVVVFGYLKIFFLCIRYQEKQEIMGFDMAKEVTSNYDYINIVEVSNSCISQYHLRRRVLRFTKKLYYATDLFSLMVASYLSCISLSDSKYLKWIGKIIPSIDWLCKSSCVMIILSCFMYSKGDAKIEIILGSVILFIQYIYLQISFSAIEIAEEKVCYKKDNIINIMNQIYFSNKLFFVSSLIFILRFVVIVIK